MKNQHLHSLLLLTLLFTATRTTFGASTELRMTLEEATEYCQNWFKALVLGENELEPTVRKLLTQYYTEETVLIDPNFPEPQVGLTAIGNYYRAILPKYPNWEFKIVKIYPTQTGFVLHYKGKAPGVVEDFYGIDILEINKEGKITKLVEGYDRTPFIQASNPTPAPERNSS